MENETVVSDVKVEFKFGFVCPEWAKSHWNPAECVIMQCTDDTFAVIDHSLNGVVVYVGKSHEECSLWLKGEPTWEIIEVDKAEPYRVCAMQSYGNASRMLIAQYNFPCLYVYDLDILESQDSDRIISRDYSKAMSCMLRHTGRGSDFEIESWLRDSDRHKIMAYIKEMLGVDPMINWTGFRVLGTVGGRGQNVWRYQLFYKHPKTNTEVYTGLDAPNILPGLRWKK
jgi:hypothetical protein